MYADHGARLGDGDYARGCYHNGQSENLARTVKIHRSWTDGADEPVFAWIVEFDDGTFAAVEGGHDYTGWDCQSSIDFHPCASVEEAMRLVSDDPRRAWQEEQS